MVLIASPDEQTVTVAMAIPGETRLVDSSTLDKQAGLQLTDSGCSYTVRDCDPVNINVSVTILILSVVQRGYLPIFQMLRLFGHVQSLRRLRDVELVAHIPQYTQG